MIISHIKSVMAEDGGDARIELLRLLQRPEDLHRAIELCEEISEDVSSYLVR